MKSPMPERWILASALTWILMVPVQSLAEDVQIDGAASADIAVSIDDGAAIFEPGSSIFWTIVVTNAGPGITLAQVFDTFPDGVSGVTWSCSASSGAVCSMSGDGNLSDVVYLPSGSTLTYLATAHVTAPVGTSLSNTVLAGTLNGVVDPDGSNNVATDTDQIAYINAPVVLRLNSAASPGNCLSDGLETRTGITQLVLRFSQAMLNPAGDADPHDVTNPSSYRVIEAGSNGAFDSTGCADAPAGDDQLIAISSVEYVTDSFQASLHVDANSKALPGGRYRVLACGSALQSTSGMALDGSASGNPGSDYRSDFRVLGTNVLVNPNFDHDVSSGWRVPDDGSVAVGSTDVDGISSSGSAMGASELHVMTQCVSGLAQGMYVFNARSMNQDSGIVNGNPGAVLPYVDLDCSVEAPFGAGGSSLFITHVQGAWDNLTGDLVWLGPAPPGGWSLLVLIPLNAAPGMNSYFDSASLQREDDDIMFRDGVDATTLCPAP